jgi:glucose-6-phosphate isomerase
MAITLREQYLEGFVSPHEMDCMAPQVAAAVRQLRQHTGAGSDFHGWLTLPRDYDKEELSRIHAAAEKIREDTDVLVVIGIGGSYLGARSAIELLRSPYYNALGKDGPAIYFAGCNLSGSYLDEILALCEGKRVSLNVISKSGTTTEPALAFRVLRGMMERRYGKEAAERIYCTTDRARGTLKSLADREGWQTFVIPDDVGGRYSVLTAVGLLPMAVAGIDIDAVLRGAQKAMTELDNDDFSHNPCYRYAAIRNILLRRGKAIEIYASYEPRFTQMGEWLKQLYGESEGKDGKGLFPASVAFTTDLHSMGQFIQDGSRNLFETVIDFITPAADLTVEEDPENLDGLNFLSGMAMRQINRRAMQGTILAHTRGGVPNLVLEVPAINEEEYGYMVYFFMLACGISGYLLGVNPFDQPGVEAYKKNMFALLGKPGYEDLRQELLEKLGE